MELIAGENDNGRRLDRVLRKALPDSPLPLLHRLLRQRKVLVNGKPAKAQDRIQSGDTIEIPLKNAPKQAFTGKIPALKADLQIIWQDKGLLAVNKPAFLAVHGPDSLDDMVRSFLADKLPSSLSFKPGPLHRLDKPSSGIVVFSASLEGARLFTSLMRERIVKKTYLAIVEGKVEKEALWQDCLVRDKEIKKTFVSQEKTGDGKTAVTKVKPLAAKDGFSLIEVEIETGRTHQIRAQAAFHGHPLCGDKKYGARSKGGFFLHAWKMEFLDVILCAPVPQEFLEKHKLLFGEDLILY